MDYRYAVLGTGKQGTAAAYDLAVHGEAEEILLVDEDAARVRLAHGRLQRLLRNSKPKGRLSLRSLCADARHPTALLRRLKARTVLLSALPYWLNPAVAALAVRQKIHYLDLGGHLDTTLKILKGLAPQAQKNKTALLPDCGLAPGLVNLLAVCGMETLELCREVKIYCGGLPQNPSLPLGYKAAFHLGGLLENYFGKAAVLRKGKVTFLPALSEYETLELPELGPCEAFLTAGATSTCPWSFQGRLSKYDYKTVRYPGHCEKIVTLDRLGFFNPKPVRVNGHAVAPRELFLKLAQKTLEFPKEKDLVIFQVRCIGSRQGTPTEIRYDGLDYHDPQTGFSAMERTTGFAAAAVAHLVAMGKTCGVCLEKSIPARPFLEALRQRGLRILETIRDLQEGPLPAGPDYGRGVPAHHAFGARPAGPDYGR
ncbi:MAG: saccharopine dehydrogenase NADP-binding domain-containing protein [Elusimicrobia bacterium]|nr:saccharopine dehydrogenase NADP-binding domain-containing protein [Elusimicrobiota bacterium]